MEGLHHDARALRCASVYVASGRITFSEPSAEIPKLSLKSIAGSCTTIHGHNVELTF